MGWVRGGRGGEWRREGFGAEGRRLGGKGGGGRGGRGGGERGGGERGRGELLEEKGGGDRRLGCLSGLQLGFGAIASYYISGF